MSQVFKKPIPKNALFDFLEKIGCKKTDKFYIVDIIIHQSSTTSTQPM